MITYIKYIIWRFAKHEPENFKLLDIRYNVMKILILGNCDDLIKFILFGDEETEKERYENEKEKRQNIRHIPSNKLWPGSKFLNDDDLDPVDKLEDNETIELKNNMELAIYHCKGRWISTYQTFMVRKYLS